MIISLKNTLAAILLFSLSILTATADDLLFIGNSFTQGAGDIPVVNQGGIPGMVKTIATAKGKTVDTGIVATGGKDWGFHLTNPATDTALKSKPWNFVVLQDYSTKPTRAGNVDEFMKNGDAFYDRIAQESPTAQIVLYQTWAYDAQNPIFAGAPNPKKLTGPDEMIEEITKNYGVLQAALNAKNPSRPVLLARVGEAFALCHKEHPEMVLNSVKDFKHASQLGSYLASLVLYATIYQDSPKGATTSFGAPTSGLKFTIDPKDAETLQSVAEEVTAKK